MSELSPSEIAQRTAKSEIASKGDRFSNAKAIIAIDSKGISTNSISDRYPRKDWVVTEDISLHGILDDSASSRVRLGYPLQGVFKKPQMMHLIIDDKFATPWASIGIGESEWMQLIDDQYSDTILSARNQLIADKILNNIKMNAERNKQARNSRRRKIIGSLAAVGIVAGGAYAGYEYYSSIQEEDAARERAIQQKIAAFDAEWAAKDLTGSPIPADVFGNVTIKQLPSDIPAVMLDRVTESNSKYKFREPLSNNQIRLINLVNDGCYVIETDIEEDTTISAATNETKDSIVVALVDDENVLKICKNGLYSLNKPADIAIQIHQK